MADAPATKYPWESKTIVLNALMALLTVVATFFPAANVVTAWVSANGVLIGTVWSVLNIVLRFISKDAIVLGD